MESIITNTQLYAEQVSEAKLRELLRCRFEADDLAFRVQLDLASDKERVELCRDVIAMANTRGGHVLFGVRAETPPAGPASLEMPSEREPLTRLRHILATRLSAGDLRTLCFDLGIDYDDLPDEGRANKARELVTCLEQRGRTSELATAGKRLRPDVPWDELLQAVEDATSDTQALPAEETPARDAGFALQGLPFAAYVDPGDLAQALDDFVHEPIDFHLAYHDLEIEGQRRLFAILYVAPSPIPIVTSRAGAYQDGNRQRMAFAEAELLVRSGNRSKRAGPDEVRALLQDRQRPSASLAPTTQATSAEREPPVIHNLPRPNFLNFIGREAEIREVMETLDHERAWVVSIEGIGGVGKTALAQKVALDLVSQAYRTGVPRWKFIIWMSAKETVLGPDRIEEVRPGFRNLGELFDVILDVTGLRPDGELGHDRKQAEVKDILSAFPCLLIVDNLETVDTGAVERFVVEELPAPSKAIITSRRRTARKGGLTVSLKGMDTEKAIHLLREAAHYQCCPVIASAPQARLEEIVQLTGGIPLALKLVVGQTALGANLDVVVERLMYNRDVHILDFCFTETYKCLSPESKKLLGAIALCDWPATLDEVAMIAQVPYGPASRHIESLVRLSLVDESSDDGHETQVYSMLPLTRIFAKRKVDNLTDFYQEARRRISLYLVRKQQLPETDLDAESVRQAKARTELERIAVGLADSAEREYQAGRYEQAIDLLREAEVLGPRLAYVQERWAYIERREDHVQAARERYQRAVEYDYTTGAYYRYWASLEAKVGQYNEAVRLYREAILLDRADVRAGHGLAHSLLQRARRLQRVAGRSREARAQLLEALEIIEAAFDSSPVETRGNPVFWWTKAQILQALRRPRQALDACEAGLGIGYDRRLANLAADLKYELDR
jgi:tetratricopeptide (TPR) repeat protein